jgi:hypothetical protein
MTRVSSELLKVTFEFLLSTTTSRKVISAPLTFAPLSKAAIKELAEYIDSWAVATTANPKRHRSDVIDSFIDMPYQCLFNIWTSGRKHFPGVTILTVESVLDRVLLFAAMIFGIVSIPFGFPGTIIILASVFVYALATHFAAGIGVTFFVVLCILTLIAETADNWLSAVGAKRYGASTASIWLSFIGGVGGAILIGGPISVLLGPLGPIAGGFFGAFAIVVAHELYLRKNLMEALRAGWGTFIGRMAGMILKVVISAAMIISVAAAMLF